MSGSPGAIMRIDAAPALTPGLGRVARDAVTVLAIQVCGAGLAYLSQVALARWMGVASFGTYAYLIAWVTIAALLAGLGFPISVLRLIPQYRTTGEPQHLRGVISISRAVALLAGVALALAGTVLALLWQPSVGTFTLAIAVWLIPLGAVINVDVSIMRAGGRLVAAYAPSQVLRPALVLLGAGAMFAVDGALSSESALAFTVAAFAATAIAQTVLVARVARRAGPPGPAAYQPRAWLRLSLPLLLVAGFQIVLSQTDVVLVGSVAGFRDAGVYAAAARTAGLGAYLLIALLGVMAPMFAELQTRGDRAGLQRLASFCAQCAFWPTVVITLVLALSAPFVLGLFGPGFGAGREVLLILLVGQLFNAACGAVGALLNMTGHQDDVARVYGVVCVLNVVGCFALVRAFGVNGAACATTLSLITWNLWLHRLTVLRLRVRPSILSAFALRGGGSRSG
jgi:O-antigen/teichoic acid export membrane protein